MGRWRQFVRITAAALSFAVAPPLRAGEFVDQDVWYASADAPAGGTGSTQSPFNSLAALQAALDQGSKDGKLVHLAGEFRGERLYVADLSNSTITQWPDMPQAIIRGDTIIDGVWLEHVPGTHYSTSVSAAEVVSVVEDWDIRVLPDGRRYGHMREVISLNELVATPGSWLFDGTFVHIHPSHDGRGGNPNTNGKVYAWCTNGHGVQLPRATNVLVSNLDLRLWVDDESGRGYAVHMASAIDCTIENCTATDYGYHAYGFVGIRCANNTFRNCSAGGGRPGSTAYVFYSSTGNDIVGARGYACESHLYGLLNTSGGSLESDWSHGFYSHTGFGTMMQDVAWRDCTAYGYVGSKGYAFSAGAFCPTPADLDDPEQYPVRFYDCAVINGATNQLGPGLVAAFIRCRFDLPRAGEEGISLPAVFIVHGGTAQVKLLFESCVISTNTDGMTSPHIFRAGWPVQLRLFGCTIYDDGRMQVGNRDIFNFTTLQFQVFASQSVFAHRAHRPFARSADDPLQPQNLAISDCWYWNITPDAYVVNSTFPSIREFQTTIDPAGVYEVNPGFVAAPENLEGSSGAPLARMANVLPAVDRLGVNFHAYSGHYGAYQYGGLQCLADFNQSDDVDAADLALLLGSWGSCTADECLADLNGDDEVNAADLAILLGAWGPATNCPGSQR